MVYCVCFLSALSCTSNWLHLYLVLRIYYINPWFFCHPWTSCTLLFIFINPRLAFICPNVQFCLVLTLFGFSHAALFANSLCGFLWLWTLPVQICPHYSGLCDPRPSVQLRGVSEVNITRWFDPVTGAYHQLDEVFVVLLSEKMNRVYSRVKKQRCYILWVNSSLCGWNNLTVVDKSLTWDEEGY